MFDLLPSSCKQIFCFEDVYKLKTALSLPVLLENDWFFDSDQDCAKPKKKPLSAASTYLTLEKKVNNNRLHILYLVHYFKSVPKYEEFTLITT